MQIDILRKDNRKHLEDEIENFSSEMRKLRQINRNWDAGLTIVTISLTLIITVLTSFDQVDEQSKKVATGILGGIIVAIQSLGNAFPVKQRAGSYRLLYSQVSNLLTDIKHVEDENEIKTIESQFYELRIQAAKNEG